MVESLFAANLSDFKPEALERSRFLLGIVVFPVLLGAFNFLGFQLLRRGRWPSGNHGWLMAGSALGLAGLGAYLVWVTPFFWQDHRMQPALGLLAAVLLALPSIMSKRPSWRDQPRQLYFAACLAISLPVAGYYLITPAALQEDPIFGYHFNAVFHSIVQVLFGKALHVDFPNQYGLYPHFLAPLFKLMGLSVFKFSLVMTGMVLIAFTSLSLLLDRMLSSRLFAFAAFSAIIYYASVFPLLVTPEDRYYQYVPLRFVFPAIGLLMAWLYLSAPHGRAKQLAYWGMHLLCGISVLWNLDTGLVLLLTWVLLLAYLECFKGSLREIAWGMLKQGATALTVLASVLLLYMSAIFLQHGALPPLHDSLAYQKIFYLFGFFMLPMPLLHPWNLVVLSYLIGLSTSVQALLTTGTDRNRAAMALFISVLGIGLFSYYQGRSHDFNLIHVLYPAILLWAMGLDALCRASGDTPRISLAVARGVSVVTLTAMLIVPCITLLASLPRVIEIQSKLRTADAGSSEIVERAERSGLQPCWPLTRRP
jgi:hypothetical protein